jgi:hypothetical protein
MGTEKSMSVKTLAVACMLASGLMTSALAQTPNSRLPTIPLDKYSDEQKKAAAARRS